MWRAHFSQACAHFSDARADFRNAALPWPNVCTRVRITRAHFRDASLISEISRAFRHELPQQRGGCFAIDRPGRDLHGQFFPLGPVGRRFDPVEMQEHDARAEGSSLVAVD